MSTNDKLFCDVAMDLGFINSDQANAAIELQHIDAAIGQAKPVAAYFLEKSILSKDQVAHVLRMTDRIQANAPIAAPSPASAPIQQRAIPIAPDIKQRAKYRKLGMYMGCIGMHNFYAGYYVRGILQLLITGLFGWMGGIGLLVTAVWAIIEIATVTTDARGVPMA